jgi:hypothetical protein
MRPKARLAHAIQADVAIHDDHFHRGNKPKDRKQARQLAAKN